MLIGPFMLADGIVMGINIVIDFDPAKQLNCVCIFPDYL